jgi:hypothetical protein
MKVHFRPLNKNQKGFHHILLAIVVVVLVAIFGTYYIVQSKAATVNQPILNANGKCLNNQKDRGVARNPIEIYTCTGKQAQQWTVRGNAIVNANGFCLASLGRTNGSYVVIQLCNKSTLQDWVIDRAAKTIVSKPSGLCLGVERGSSQDKALVQVATCTGLKTQQWTVKYANAPPIINNFTATPTSVTSGKTTTLNWSVSGRGTCSVTPGGPTGTTATTWTTPALTANTTYTLICRQNDGQTTSSSTAVTVTSSAPTSSTSGKFGMSTPVANWDQRLAEVGGPAVIKYRRVYYTSFTDSLTLVKKSVADGMIPIISFKTGRYSWSQVASGAADADLQTMIKNLNAIPGEKFVAIHHEPASDGTEADWSAMQLHALPIIKNGAAKVSVGVIGNGWWWSSRSNGLSDAEIAKWLPSNLIAICDVVGADTYEDEGLKEDGSVKIANMVAWSKRVGGVKAIGIGEWNGLTAASITRTMNVIKSEPLVKWAAVWNSADSGVGLYLSGDRLDAFRAGVATSAR